MKLRNKKTGKVIEWFNNTEGIFPNSLAELNEEWEDYEEPKEHYILNGIGIVRESTLRNTPKYRKEIVELIINNNKSIGNYFDTREEAEKAVEKLKAIQRLKSYYIKFKLDFVKNKIDFTYRIDGTLHSSVDEERIIFEDLDLLFGGEE